MTEGVGARETTIVRVFDAPRELVWKEWTEPGRLAAWWGPRGWNTPPERVEMDVRPGGVFRVTSVSDEDGTEMVQEGVYREVVEPERLVLEEAAEGAWHGGATTVVTFADLGDGRTEMVFRTTIRTTEEGLDAAAAGLAGAFDRLAEHLIESRAREGPTCPSATSAMTTERGTGMLLEGKNAVIYGAGGGVGGGVARTFAREGARVFLVGRTRETLEAVAEEISAAGGSAEVAVMDALDERAVDEHARDVAERAGGIDVSFNLVSRGDVQGIPLVEMETEDFVRPITTGITANFVTARAAARQMIERGSGVILALDSGSANGSPMMGGTGPADAAIDTLVRNLAAEVGPQGVRVLGLWIAGVPETFTPENLAAVDSTLVLDDLLVSLAEMRMLRRSPGLAEVGDVAAFLASDRAAGMTGTFVNVTGGMIPS